jgi:hypothetical protein
VRASLEDVSESVEKAVIPPVSAVAFVPSHHWTMVSPALAGKWSFGRKKKITSCPLHICHGRSSGIGQKVAR